MEGKRLLQQVKDVNKYVEIVVQQYQQSGPTTI
jgi:hypothetical protein